MHFLREKINHALNRLVGVVCVESRHTQMPGFCKGHRIFHRLSTTDFTDQDHIRSLSQGVFQCHFVGDCIQTDLTLLGYAGARQPDNDRVRTWEVAGTGMAPKAMEYGTMALRY